MSFFPRVAIFGIIGIVGINCFGQNAGPSRASKAGGESGLVAWLKKQASKDAPKAKTPLDAGLDSLPALHHSGLIELFPALDAPAEPTIVTIAAPSFHASDDRSDCLECLDTPSQPFPPHAQMPENPDATLDSDAPMPLDSTSSPSLAPDLDYLDLMWPVETRTISSGWGPRRRTAIVVVKTPEGSRRISKPYTGTHKGIDLTAPQGYSIFAAMDGRVCAVGRNRMMGNYVTIDHGDGIETFYGHNKANLVAVGDMVLRGQVIATVGSTGSSTGPHVHFEVRVNGQQVNPAPFLNDDEEELSPEMIGLNEQTLSKTAKANRR